MIVFADFTNKQFNDHNLILIIAEKTKNPQNYFTLSVKEHPDDSKSKSFATNTKVNGRYI